VPEASIPGKHIIENVSFYDKDFDSQFKEASKESLLS
jgi:hypothetical protein